MRKVFPEFDRYHKEREDIHNHLQPLDGRDLRIISANKQELKKIHGGQQEYAAQDLQSNTFQHSEHVDLSNFGMPAAPIGADMPPVIGAGHLPAGAALN